MQIVNELTFEVKEDTCLPIEFVETFLTRIFTKRRYFVAWCILVKELKKNHFKEPGAYRITYTDRKHYKIYRIESV